MYRGHLSCHANYVGGRLDGQLSAAGWHGLYRDESGRSLDDRQIRQIPSHYYRLYTCGPLIHYVHSSLVPADYDNPLVAG